MLQAHLIDREEEYGTARVVDPGIVYIQVRQGIDISDFLIMLLDLSV